MKRQFGYGLNAAGEGGAGWMALVLSWGRLLALRG